MTKRLYTALAERILLLDGGFGTMMQQNHFDEADYRGARFQAHPIPLKGCNDLLSLTQPASVAEIHDKYLRAGADIITSNSFNANRISLSDYGLASYAREMARAAAQIARTVADNGYSVMYESAGHLFGKMERAKFANDEQARRDCDKYLACDLLIVDDLGTEMPGQFTTAALYGLINDRLLAGKPTIISTNLTIEEFERRYNRQIASRLRGSYVRVPFVGEDIRVQKNRGL